MVATAGTLNENAYGYSKDDLEVAKFVINGGTEAAVRVYSGTQNPTQVSEATLLAGEDLTNNVIKVEERFSYTYVGTVGTVTIKSGSGFLHTLNIGVSSAGGALTIYDSVGTSATVIGVVGTTTAVDPLPTRTYDVTFATGLTIANVGTQTYTVSYR